MDRAADTAYLVAGNRPWNRRLFDLVIAKQPGRWQFCATPAALTLAKVAALNPRDIRKAC